MDRGDEMEMKEESVEARVQVMAVSRFRRICVFCGSSKGKKTSYQDAAVELGKELVRTHLPSFSLVLHSFWHHFSTLASFYELALHNTPASFF
jgi:hypothetical protein